MTPDQTIEVIRQLRANWTYFEPNADVLALWARETADISAAIALEAVQRIIEKDHQLPSIARFLAECQNVSRGRALPPPARPEPERIPRPDFVEGLAKARAALQSAKGWAPPDDHVALKVVSDG